MNASNSSIVLADLVSHRKAIVKSQIILYGAIDIILGYIWTEKNVMYLYVFTVFIIEFHSLEIGLPDVRFLSVQSGIFNVCPEKNKCLYRTEQCHKHLQK